MTTATTARSMKLWTTCTLLYTQWISPEELSKLEEDTSLKLIEGSNVVASFDTSNMTDGEKRAFIQECIESYRKISSREEYEWKKIQDLIADALRIPRRKLKATTWRPIFAAEALDRGLKVVWRQNKLEV